MIEYKGHLLPNDLYYLVISYANISKWYINNNLIVIEDDKPPREVEHLTKEELDILIQQSINYNLNKIIYEFNIKLKGIDKL